MRKKATRGSMIIAVVVAAVVLPVLFLIIKEVVRTYKFNAITTEVTKEGILRITDDGTASMGSNWEVEIVGDAIVQTDEYKMSTGFFTGTKERQAFEYEAVKEGNALVLVRAMHTGSYQYTDMYAVTVDADLNISYDFHSAEAIIERSPDNSVFVKEGGTTKLTWTEFSDLARYLYGDEISFPDISQEELDTLTRLEYEDSVCYLDPENGIVCIVRTNEYGVFRTAFEIDEWLLPKFRETF